MPIDRRPPSPGRPRDSRTSRDQLSGPHLKPTDSWRGITWRSALLGLILAGGLCALTPYNDYVIGNTYIAGNHFPVGAAAVLLALSLLNLLLRRLRGRLLLTAQEITVVYIIVMVTSGIPSTGLLRYLLPVLTTPYYFATPGNRWEHVLWGHIPQWLGVSDPLASSWLWEGMPVGAHLPWGPWWLPLFRWAVLIAALWLLMLSLATLVRKQWADRERLAFPIVQFPLEVLRPSDGTPALAFFRNRLVWVGTGAIFFLHLLNGLHQHFPAIPNIPTFWDLDYYLTDRPWSAMAPLYVALFPAAIGFAYLLTLEVAAGFWVATLFLKAEGVVLSSLGYEGASAWGGVISQVTRHEQMGGLLVLSLVLLWSLRGTMAKSLRSIFTPSKTADDAQEPLSYRFAAAGLVCALAVAFAWLVAAGMEPLPAAGFLLVLAGIYLVLTRIVAEAGMLMVHLSFTPADYLLAFSGSAALGSASLTVLTFVDCALTWDLREFFMPSALNAFRLAEQSGIRTRKLSGLIGAALVLCALIAVPAFLYTCYHSGAASTAISLGSHPRRFFAALASQLENPSRPANVKYLSMAAGGALVAMLTWLRAYFVWWPIHPLGFVMATSWASLNLWFSLFVGWLLKLLTIRYFGLRGYVQLRPLFMGIIMGDILAAVFWIIVGLFTRVGIMVTVN